MNELYQTHPVYFSFAIAGSLLFVAKMILFLVAGDGGESDSLDIDVDVDGDGVAESHMDGGQTDPFQMVCGDNSLHQTKKPTCKLAVTICKSCPEA